MNLGTLSEKGKIANAKADKALQFLANKYNISYIPFPTNSTSRVDGFFCTQGYSNVDCISSMYEIKTRQGEIIEDKFHFEGKVYDTQLIVYQKLVDGMHLSEYLNVPFLLVVVFWNYIYIWKIDEDLIKESEVKETLTKYDINGRTALRMNCYLPFTKAVLKTTYDEV